MLESYKVIRCGFFFFTYKALTSIYFLYTEFFEQWQTSLDIDISSFFQLKIACRHCRSSFSATLDRKFPK